MGTVLLNFFLFLFLLFVVYVENATYYTAFGGTCNSQSSYYTGTCRFQRCLTNETFYPGPSYCDVYTSYLRSPYVRCVRNIPCCVWGGTCRRQCGTGELQKTVDTECVASSAGVCCVPDGGGPVTNTATTPAPTTSVASRQGRCGEVTTVQRRIIGGNIATPDGWPWMVRLVYASNVRGVCAGVLVDDDTVITVAHCVTDTPANLVQVLVGDYDLTRSDPEEELVNVRSVELNTNYVSGQRGNDFAVLKLASRVSFSRYKMAACLPDPRIPLVKPSECYVAGWGVSENGQVSPQLRFARVTPMDFALCNAIITSPNINAAPLGRDMMCTDVSVSGADACLFDDGGMLVCRDTNRRFSLVGLVAEYSCGSLPTVYTRIDNYTEAILARL